MDDKKQTPLTEERLIEILDEKLGIKGHENLGEVINRLQEHQIDTNAWYVSILMHLKHEYLTKDEWDEAWQDKLINIKARMKNTKLNLSQYLELFHKDKDHE